MLPIGGIKVSNGKNMYYPLPAPSTPSSPMRGPGWHRHSRKENHSVCSRRGPLWWDPFSHMPASSGNNKPSCDWEPARREYRLHLLSQHMKRRCTFTWCSMYASERVVIRRFVSDTRTSRLLILMPARWSCFLHSLQHCTTSCLSPFCDTAPHSIHSYVHG